MIFLCGFIAKRDPIHIVIYYIAIIKISIIADLTITVNIKFADKYKIFTSTFNILTDRVDLCTVSGPMKTLLVTQRQF